MRVFFSAPFTKEFDFAARRYRDPSYPRFLQAVTGLLEQFHHEVYLAQRDEEWGVVAPLPGSEAAKDFDFMRRWCDCVLCYPGDYSSIGVCIELGWASALSKKILLLEQDGQTAPPYIQSLRTLTDLTVVRFADTPTLLARLTEEVG